MKGRGGLIISRGLRAGRCASGGNAGIHLASDATKVFAHVTLNTGRIRQIRLGWISSEFHRSYKIPYFTVQKNDSRQGALLPPGDIWQCLETSGVVITGLGVATGIYCSEAKVLLNVPQCTEQNLHNKDSSSPKCQLCPSWETLISKFIHPANIY